MIHIFMAALVGQWQQLTGGGLFHNELNIIRRIVVFVVWLWLLLIAHSIAMVSFEGMSLADALWLSITTITTVGYGDYSASTFLGRASTVVLLYIGGISLLAALASDYVDYRIARRERVGNGKWDWNMHDHILILNSPVYNAEIYFRRIVSQIREVAEYRRTPIQILTDSFSEGLPIVLQEMGVHHYRGSPNHFDDRHGGAGLRGNNRGLFHTRWRSSKALRGRYRWPGLVPGRQCTGTSGLWHDDGLYRPRRRQGDSQSASVHPGSRGCPDCVGQGVISSHGSRHRPMYCGYSFKRLSRWAL